MDEFGGENDEESLAATKNIKDTCERQLAIWQSDQISLEKRLITIGDSSDSCGTTTSDLDVNDIQFVGGADISFPACKDDLVHACCAFVVTSFPNLEVVYKDISIIHLTAPYIPEYLAFREAQFFEEAYGRLNKEHPEFSPQVLLLDGNGILHPRGFGVASHVGVLIGLPTVGVAKNLFHVDGLERNEEHRNKISDLLKEAGDAFELVGKSGKVLGKALRSTDKSSNPIYISIGHMISLNAAVDIVNKCCKYRTPEAVRQADILSREFIRENYEEHVNSCQLDWQKKSKYFRAVEEQAALLKLASIETEKTTDSPSKEIKEQLGK